MAYTDSNLIANGTVGKLLKLVNETCSVCNHPEGCMWTDGDVSPTVIECLINILVGAWWSGLDELLVFSYPKPTKNVYNNATKIILFSLNS